MSGGASNRLAWLTPDSAPASTRCRRVFVPDDEAWIAIVSGALVPLIYPEHWEQFGTLTPEQAAERAKEMFLRYLSEEDCIDMIGSIMPYASSAAPSGMLPCDGGVYQRADYPRLYEALDSAFILGPDTFQVPDLRGKFVLGSNGSYPVASTGGAETHTLTEAEMPSHSHGINAYTDILRRGVTDSELIYLDSPIASLQTESTGGDQAHNNMPPYVALKWGIVAR